MEITNRETTYSKTIELVVLRLDDGRELTMCRIRESDPDFSLCADDLEPEEENDELYNSLDDDTRERIDELVRPDLND